MKKIFGLCLVVSQLSYGQQPFVANYDEAKIPPYTLPDPLQRSDGTRVETAQAWTKQRGYWLNQFAKNVYGITPTQRVKVQYQTLETKTVMEGKAIRKRTLIKWTDYPQLAPMEVLLYIPTQRNKPAPVAMGLNFMGNHSTTTETDLPISTRWARNTNDGTVVNSQFTDKSRGVQAERWQIKALIDNGIALATAYYGDIEPDHPDGWKVGIRSVLGDTTRPDNWGAIGAWAWSMSRIMDYLETEPQINTQRSFLTGHSRIGKAALWAAAQDERFALINANNAGEGGAALSRRNFGETIARLNTVFPHWFCQNYRQYNDNAAQLPTDQHILLALLAPRPLYVASASEDSWADPNGEFLSLKAAEPVYALWGKLGPKDTTQPPVNHPVGSSLRYHLRKGPHDITGYDWQQYIDFMKAHWR